MFTGYLQAGVYEGLDGVHGLAAWRWLSAPQDMAVSKLVLVLERTKSSAVCPSSMRSAASLRAARICSFGGGSVDMGFGSA